ncbi:SsgA family sporulation/cell division regulator [Streptomyces sp. NPDC059991]|uniref:SsgA family sporulation/cell division regulator n=1 Tax=unclassified Streptomyces TaxID=2593676 RepID=UPI00369F6AAD
MEEICVPLYVELLHEGGDAMTPVEAVMTYDSDDPLAVSVDFVCGNGTHTTWTMGRDLVAEGLTSRRPVGMGDVRVWYCGDGGLRIRLDSDEGSADLLAGLEDVAEFLSRTYQLVPEGSELDGYDVDAVLDLLFAPAPSPAPACRWCGRECPCLDHGAQ